MLQIEGLRVVFPGDGRPVEALRGFDCTLDAGETLGVVGESGSGKSTAFLAAARLLPPAARITARVLRAAGVDVLAAGEAEMRALRGRGLAFVFQDSSASLNPYLKIGTQLSEVLALRRGLRGSAAREAAAAELAACAVRDPEAVLDRHPHALSGGQRQRVCVAMALLAEPDVLVADEPTTALDPSVQLQVLALLAKTRRERRCAMILISHDLGAVASLADRVAVVYAGRVVEGGSAERVLARPRHPYTAALSASAAALDGPRLRRLHAVDGTPPRPGDRIAGCAFAPRCAFADARCAAEEPPFTATADGGVACFHPLEPAP